LPLGHARRRHRPRGRADDRRADPAPVLRARGAPRVPRRPGRARAPRGGRPRRPQGPARAEEGRRVTAAALPATRRVERWTWVSGGFTAALAGVIVLLAFAPFVLGSNALNNLIQLYFLVVLAVMWNALAGYGGLVS